MTACSARRHLACFLCPALSLPDNPCTGLPEGHPARRYTEPDPALSNILNRVMLSGLVDDREMVTRKERSLNIRVLPRELHSSQTEGRRGGDAALLNTTDEWTCEMGMRLPTSSR
ncbi:hypothetical protein JB92DRAFT_3018988 [Gautieria morchelliformis]|nr:hypothetical protein JB92DRAFT_3018988 [Gautieria morchelliformis]